MVHQFSYPKSSERTNPLTIQCQRSPLWHKIPCCRSEHSQTLYARLCYLRDRAKQMTWIVARAGQRWMCYCKREPGLLPNEGTEVSAYKCLLVRVKISWKKEVWVKEEDWRVSLWHANNERIIRGHLSMGINLCDAVNRWRRDIEFKNTRFTCNHGQQKHYISKE